MKQLLNRPAPYPDESLISWLWRVAFANYLDSASLLLRYVRHLIQRPFPIKQDCIRNLRESYQFEALARFTNISTEQVYNCTLHRFAHVFTRPEREVHYVQLMPDHFKQLLPTSGYSDFYGNDFRWCPHCLADDNYIRLDWHSALVTCCTIHGCWLMDQCPECDAKIRALDIANGYCGTCLIDLATLKPRSIPNDDLMLDWNRLLRSWLYGAKDHMFTEGIPINVALRVLRGLRFSAQRAGEDWYWHHRPPHIPRQQLDIFKQRQLTMYERGCLYTTAYRGLLNWPYSFYEFMDAYRQRPGSKEDTGLRREFGTIYISWISRFWNHPAYHAVQNAFNNYLVDHIPVYQIVKTRRIREYPELWDQLQYLDMNRSRIYLHSSVLSIYRLADEGHLTIHRFADDEDGVWLLRDELDALLAIWETHISLAELVNLLGMSLRLVRALIDDGLLELVAPSEAVRQATGTYVYISSLETMLELLRQHTVVLKPIDDDSISLNDVCIQHGGSVSLNFVQVVRRIQEGRLRSYHPNQTLLPLSDLKFDAHDIENLAYIVKTEQDVVNLTEAQEALGVTRIIFQCIVDAGLLQPVRGFGPKQFYRSTDIENVKMRWLDTNGVAQILDVQPSYIHSLVKQGNFPAISGPSVNQRGHYLFDREEVLKWQSHYVLYRELRRSVSDIDQLMRLIKEQDIKPIARHPNVYLREEVMLCIQEMRNENR